MLAAQSSGHHDHPPPTTVRRPLQPKNHQPPSLPSTTAAVNLKPNPPPAPNTNNKENQHLFYRIAPPKKKILDAGETAASLSLADELTAVREKLEKQRIDRDNTENLLRQRSLALDLHLKEILDRGEIQKQLEIELDRLYRLKEIRLACTRISQIRSLRDKEDEKKMKYRDTSEVDGEGKGEKSSQPSISISDL